VCLSLFVLLAMHVCVCVFENGREVSVFDKDDELIKSNPLEHARNIFSLNIRGFIE